MDELCDLLHSQNIYDPKENSVQLFDALKTCRRFIQGELYVDNQTMDMYIKFTRERYNTYIRCLNLNGNFNYIGKAISEYMEITKDDMNTQDMWKYEELLSRILRLSFFIDCELCFVSGALSLDNIQFED